MTPRLVVSSVAAVLALGCLAYAVTTSEWPIVVVIAGGAAFGGLLALATGPRRA